MDDVLRKKTSLLLNEPVNENGLAELPWRKKELAEECVKEVMGGHGIVIDKGNDLFYIQAKPSLLTWEGLPDRLEFLTKDDQYRIKMQQLRLKETDYLAEEYSKAPNNPEGVGYQPVIRAQNLIGDLCRKDTGFDSFEASLAFQLLKKVAAHERTQEQREKALEKLVGQGTPEGVDPKDVIAKFNESAASASAMSAAMAMHVPGYSAEPMVISNLHRMDLDGNGKLSKKEIDAQVTGASEELPGDRSDDFRTMLTDAAKNLGVYDEGALTPPSTLKSKKQGTRVER